jgi:endonuclease/exonuclease/phosphatase (EEP) superfamily protein YafD
LFPKPRGLVRATRWGLGLVIIHQCYWLLPSLRPPSSATSPTTSEISFSVAVFNVLHSNQKTTQTIDYFQSLDTDVIAFFESSRHWPEALQSLKEQWPHHLRIDRLDMELHSKHPIASEQIFRYGERRGFVACDLLIEETPVTVIINHTYPLITFGEQGYHQRNEQLAALANIFTKHTDPLIVMGDFNASTWSPPFRKLLQSTGWKRAPTGFGVLGTHALIAPETALLAHPIDHLLASDSVRILDAYLGPYLGSDHRPILMQCAVKAN